MIVSINEEVEIPKVQFKNREVLELVDNWVYQSLPGNRCDGDVAKQFGYLLKLAGIDSAETCIISYDRQYSIICHSIKCYLKKANNKADITLFLGDRENFPSFAIDYHNTKKEYTYFPETTYFPMIFKPKCYRIVKPNDGYTFVRRFHNDKSEFSITKGQYDFSMVIGKKWIDQQNQKNYNYVPKLQNEEGLTNYLLGLVFPCVVEDVYKEIKELSLQGITEFPHIRLEIKKDGTVTDAIDLSLGTWTEFTKTNDGQTISLGYQGDLTYQDDLVDYRDGILCTRRGLRDISSVEKIEEIEEKARKVKKIARDIFQSK